MPTTNWDKALTYAVNCTRFTEEVGKERVQEMLLALFEAGGSFAVSQDTLHMSDFSMLVFHQRAADWVAQDETERTND